MNYQINQDDLNKLVVDGEYIHYSIPIPPAPRGCSTGALIRHIWKLCEFAHFVVHVLPDHAHRPLDITVIPEKFDPNELIESKYLGIITKYRPTNFLTDLEVQYARRDKIAFDDFHVDRLIGAYENTVAAWCAEQMKYVTTKEN